jgi:glyoxylase I family protein
MLMGARLDHIGITVPDIDAATTLFESLLGARRLFDVGPFSATDDWMSTHVGVHPRAVIRTMRLLSLPGGGMMELFVYEGPGSGANQPANSEVGGYHVAIRVDDIDSAMQRAAGLGCTVMGEAKSIGEGPNAGLTWVYVRAPWGLQMEFVRYADGWPGRSV